MFTSKNYIRLTTNQLFSKIYNILNLSGAGGKGIPVSFNESIILLF